MPVGSRSQREDHERKPECNMTVRCGRKICRRPVRPSRGPAGRPAEVKLVPIAARLRRSEEHREVDRAKLKSALPDGWPPPASRNECSAAANRALTGFTCTSGGVFASSVPTARARPRTLSASVDVPGRRPSQYPTSATPRSRAHPRLLLDVLLVLDQLVADRLLDTRPEAELRQAVDHILRR